MSVGYERLVRSYRTPEEDAELEVVDALARHLRRHLDDSADEIDRVHVHGAPSGVIQGIASRLLREHLGFVEELRHDDAGLFVRPRPDFVYRLGTNRGILAEIERGGTTTNNHDLKDFWKTHIAADAHHLFLVVPHSNWSASGAGREKPFGSVCRRLGAFFGDARREVDVLSVHVFGYGRTADGPPARVSPGRPTPPPPSPHDDGGAIES